MIMKGFLNIIKITSVPFLLIKDIKVRVTCFVSYNLFEHPSGKFYS